MHGMQEAERKRRRGAASAQKRKKGLWPAALISGRRENKKGAVLAYIEAIESFWLARQGKAGGGSGCREKKNGLGCWFGPKMFFLFFFFLQKDSTNLI